jgi:uncharacterized short protein YbdD (DUF466 family)
MEGTAPRTPSDPVPALTAGRIVRAWRSVLWLLRGVLGADAYQRYLEHQARVHPGSEPLSERAFWRDRMDWEDRHPQGRCC